MKDVYSILENYDLNDKIKSISKLEIGHIHDSYQISTGSGSFFLQKINDEVFKDVAGLMSNIKLVLIHLASKTEYAEYETLRLFPTTNGSPFHDENGSYWRVYDFKTHLESQDVPNSIEQVFEAGKAFGAFSASLSDISPDRLTMTIPQFHSLQFRFDQLRRSVESAEPSSVSNLREELRFVEEQYSELVKLEENWKSGTIRTRVVHNDTKFNNVMFDESGKAKCVVDLDTVMPGIIHFDIGDGFRTTATLCDENEEDIEKVEIDNERYKSYLEGYLSGYEGHLSDEEKELIPYSGPYMSFIMGVRFLKDHLDGNIYYPAKHPNQNLARSRNQFKLTREFLKTYC